MAGPWLYPISAGADRSFTLADGQSIPVTVDSYRTLLDNGRIVEDRYWSISQNWNNIQIGDEVFVYTGDEDLGIIGYGTVDAVEQRADGWCILPRFDLGRSRALLKKPVPAAIVRDWVPFPRKAPISLATFEEPLRAHLPWKGRDAVTDSVLPEEIIQPSGLVEGALRSITVNAYERGPQAHRQCIDAHGTICCICGFSFGTVYGKVADGYFTSITSGRCRKSTASMSSIRSRTCGRSVRTVTRSCIWAVNAGASKKLSGWWRTTGPNERHYGFSRHRVLAADPASQRSRSAAEA